MKVSGVAASARVFAGRRKASRSRRCVGKELPEEMHPQALGLSGADIAKRQACYGGSLSLGMHSLSIGSHRSRVREEMDC